MKSWRLRLVISFLIALFLPFPGPHIDRYIPLIQSALHDPNWDSFAFWVILAMIWGAYTFAVFALLTVGWWLHSRRAAKESPTKLSSVRPRSGGIR